MKWIGYVCYGIYVVSTCWLLASAIIQLHLLRHSRKQKVKKRPGKLSTLPFVSIQVPVYNEKYVIEGLLQSLTQLDYPRHLFEIQVLDDSTDETCSIIDRQAAHLKQKGICISVLRRASRDGYKAGALQYGLPFCKGDLIAIFDADFQPSADFIQSLIPHFSDARVGLVQARWGHLNKHQNFLTRIQTYLLDMHFTVEQEGRCQAGYFINFCGTAGIWRKRCIIEAGGWDGSILSEDLDLSYRAQLKGWRLVYDKDIIVPAQLPAGIEAFKIQQFRWTKGMAQIAKKTLHHIWRRPLPFAKKLHSVFHLLGSFTFVCLLLNALLAIPLLQLRQQYPEFIALTNYTAIGAVNLVALAYLYYQSAETSPQKNLRFLRTYPLFVVVYLAMSVQNGVAVMQGLAGMQSPFVRTPKSTNGSTQQSYVSLKVSWITLLEAGLLLYFLYGICLSVYYHDYFLLFFFVLMCWGLVILLWPFARTLIIKDFVQHKPFFQKLKKAFSF
jgi:cellulose synthase/poly-beta-1,6-N-acetylglucosamine synthase-like glycosyltransferase